MTTIAVSGGGRARADTSSLQGSVSGTGSAVDSHGDLQTIALSADTANPTGGTFSIAGPSGASSGDVTCVYLTASGAVVGVHLSFGPGNEQFGLVFIGDGGPGGPDTLGLSDPGPTGPADCTSIGTGNALTSGDFTVTIGPSPSEEPSPEPSEQPTEEPSPTPSEEPSPEPSEEPSMSPTPPPSDDADGDGIVDTLQPPGTPFGSFADVTLMPPTTGTIVAANGLSLRITDAPSPSDGVLVVVGSEVPGAQAELSVCGGFTVLVDPGSVVTGTCGSVTLHVQAGAAEVVLGGGITHVDIPTGGTVRVSDAGNGSFAVQNLGSTEVTLTVDGVSVPIVAGGSTTAGTTDFIGFSQPVDNMPTLNRVKAGQAIPIKWRLVNAGGAPMTTLTDVTIWTSNLGCGSGASSDLIEEVAAGASALQNLGNGFYQFNWKSPKTYAGTCRTLHLDVHDGVSHDARFTFTK